MENNDFNIDNHEISEEDQDLIDRLVSKDLTEDEKKIVNLRLKDDPYFRSAVASNLNTAFLIKKVLEEEYKNDSNDDISSRPPKIYSLIIRFAAAIALFGGIGTATYFYVQDDPEVSHVALVEEYFHNDEYPFNLAVKGESRPNSSFPSNSTIDPILKSHYEKENYAAFLKELEKNSNERDLDKLQLYKGISLQKSSRTEEAIRVLESIIDQEESLQYHAMWYLAGIKLEAGNIMEAKKLLSEVATSPRGFKADEAKELLVKLDE